MTVNNLNKKNLGIIKFEKKIDKRGFFQRVFCKKKFSKVLANENINQVNRSFTKKKGSIRGMHFQYFPKAEKKIILCIKGRIWDVVVDLRKNSKTFLKYRSEILSEKNSKALYIPKGYAHGFQTLTNDCELLYFHTEYYDKRNEDGLNPFDKKIAIKWPLKVTNISKRDMSFEGIDNNFAGYNFK